MQPKPSKNRYQIGVRIAVVVTLLFFMVLSLGMELLFAARIG